MNVEVLWQCLKFWRLNELDCTRPAHVSLSIVTTIICKLVDQMELEAFLEQPPHKLLH